jgi:hypothetical protein
MEKAIVIRGISLPTPNAAAAFPGAAPNAT